MALTQNEELSDELPDSRRGTRNLGDLARLPVRSYLSVPPPLRLLSAGVMVNRAGGFVLIFLALILAVRHVSTTEIGIALIFAGTCSVAGSWLGGALVPRIGIRRTIFLSMVGSAVFTAAVALQEPYPITVAIVCLIALFSRAYPPAGATLVGRLSRPEKRIQMYAFYQLWLNFGASIGPAIAGYLLTRSLTALLLIDAATSAVFALLVLRLPADSKLPDTQGPPAPRPSCGSSRVVIQSQASESSFGQRPARLRDDRRFLLFCVGVVLTCLVFQQVSGPFLLAFRAHHYSYTLLGDLLTGHAIALLVFQMPLSYVTRRLPVWVSMTLGAALICGAYPLLLMGTSLPLLIANVAMWTAGDIIFCPVCFTVGVMMSNSRTLGSYQGAHATSRSIGLAIGPPIGVFAYSINPSLPWIGSGVVGIILVGVYFVALRRLPQPFEASKPRPASEVRSRDEQPQRVPLGQVQSPAPSGDLRDPLMDGASVDELEASFAGDGSGPDLRDPLVDGAAVDELEASFAGDGSGPDLRDPLVNGASFDELEASFAGDGP